MSTKNGTMIELPPPSIRVTHETDTVYCSDVPKDQVPAHDDYWSEASVIEHGRARARAAMERAAQIAENAHPDDWPFIASVIRAEIERDKRIFGRNRNEPSLIP
jgi:hypothetical protein